MDPAKHLPLTPAVFHILLALAAGDRHGYEIMKEVEGATQGVVKMGPGTLYGTIKRLLQLGLVDESGERPDPEDDDERRRYYKLTKEGRQVLEAETRRYAELVKVARSKGVRLSPA